MIFSHSFDNLTEEEIKLLDSYFNSMDYISSKFTFMSNYIFRNMCDISWDIFEGYLVLAALDDEHPDEGEYHMSMPLTNTGEYEERKLERAISSAAHELAKKGQTPILTLVPEACLSKLKDTFGDQIEIEHTLYEDDYIYLKTDLAELKGKKYHQKKNHLNYFKDNFVYEYEEITAEMTEEIIAFSKAKNEYISTDTPKEFKKVLEMETLAISELLKFIGTRTFGGIIRIDGKIKAVTIAEFSRTNSLETVVVHVEKADDRIRGLYQAINNEFVSRLPAETIFVNREEDMGLPYLRQAKEAYRPIKMGKKYTVKFLK